MEDLYTAAEVLSLLGIPVTGTQTRCRCPICKREGRFYMRTDGKKNTGLCFSCPSSQMSHIRYYGMTRGLSDKEAHKEILRLLGVKNYSANRQPTVVVQTEKQTPIADIEQRNAVYQEVISFLGLSERHISDMKKRGLTEEEIKKLGYASYDKSRAMDLSNHLRNRGYQLEGIPGFYERNQMYTAKWFLPGILVPYKDECNRIQGLQLRVNNEELQRENGKLKDKCRWFSSATMKNGCGCKTWYHFATDFCIDFSSWTQVPVIPKGILYLTEGGMKADIIHALSGRPVIAIPGVGTTTELKKLFESGFLQEQGVKKIVNLFDMDYITNKNVAKASEQLKILIEKYFDYERETWESEIDNHVLKGFDDFLAYMLRDL